ncbi:Coenzyme F420 hydrogenase/dehydrogenase, beta subunit C-terminal domain [Phocaeicola sartorii]|uniref:Coenzyme F420 hydrogenase/dehydrogenase, beta subunit C-terminal domain n=1 Tax=Phocaeicola sartorii TaxID=671267 RepID=UPI001F5A10BF|nr:Coenzyme F420 hydrogenase/dehydrogenase, beta subunit C-terminal domain [Phocaeicola sartorii]
MIQFNFDSFCCGCSSCFNSCPVGAITMIPNAEGFLMPVIDSCKCINCNKCNQVCPHLNINQSILGRRVDNLREKSAYLYYSLASDRVDSASGGFVFDLMKVVIEQGGYICGCVWDDNLVARHIVSNSMSDLKRMQSSKYVQSNIGSCYSEIKELLRQRKRVAFCGTPCQTAGLKTFLGKWAQSELLVSVSLICHGASSPLVWEKYKNSLEKKYNATMVGCNMRDKQSKGYSYSFVRYTFKRNDSIQEKCFEKSWPTYLNDPYIFLFTDNLFLRHCSSHCDFKAERSEADIIVGDFFASIKGAGNQGCSSLICLTEKGNGMTTILEGVLKKITANEVINVNNMIYQSIVEHPLRFTFFENIYLSKDVIALLTEYLPFRFKIKKILAKVGLFDFVRNLLK